MFRQCVGYVLGMCWSCFGQVKLDRATHEVSARLEHFWPNGLPATCAASGRCASFKGACGPVENFGMPRGLAEAKDPTIDTKSLRTWRTRTLIRRAAPTVPLQRDLAAKGRIADGPGDQE